MDTRFFNLDNRKFYPSEEELVASLPSVFYIRSIVNTACNQTLVAAGEREFTEQVAMFRCRVASGEAAKAIGQLTNAIIDRAIE